MEPLVIVSVAVGAAEMHFAKSLKRPEAALLRTERGPVQRGLFSFAPEVVFPPYTAAFGPVVAFHPGPISAEALAKYLVVSPAGFEPATY